MDTNDGRSVLVTGGRGFIGSAVGQLLQRKGYKVVSPDATALASSRAAEEDVLCDLTNAAQLQRIFEERRIRRRRSSVGRLNSTISVKLGEGAGCG